MDPNDIIRRRVRIRPDGCWEWTGTRHHAEGYGTLSIKGRTRTAHRVSYELFVGPIPDSLTIDHLCHNADLTCEGGPQCKHRPCVNPEHLDVVTASDNVLRSRTTTAARNAAKTHCPQGHPYDEANTYVIPSRPSTRYCRTCMRDRDRGRVVA